MHPTLCRLREFRHIVNRKVATPKLPQVGEPITSLPKAVEMPPYPYGAATSYKQSDRGLYGGKTLQFGHKISEYGNKHVRIFHPNVQRVSLWSETLKKTLKLRVVSSVLKTITKEGGLDAYLLKDTPQRVKSLGSAGWALRWQVLQKQQRTEKAAPRYEVEGETKVYGRGEYNGAPVQVVVGRSRLIKALYNQELDGTFTSHLSRHKLSSFQDLLDLATERQADIKMYIN